MQTAPGLARWMDFSSPVELPCHGRSLLPRLVPRPERRARLRNSGVAASYRGPSMSPSEMQLAPIGRRWHRHFPTLIEVPSCQFPSKDPPSRLPQNLQNHAGRLRLAPAAEPLVPADTCQTCRSAQSNLPSKMKISSDGLCLGASDRFGRVRIVSRVHGTSQRCLKLSVLHPGTEYPRLAVSPPHFLSMSSSRSLSPDRSAANISSPLRLNSPLIS